MKETSIEITHRGRVQIICMKRPDHGNRVSQQMGEEMVAALERARQSPDGGLRHDRPWRCLLASEGSGRARVRPSVGRASEFARAFIDLDQALRVWASR